jgi:hypothetical protein
MGPLLTVVPQEFFQDPHADPGRARPIDCETFVVQTAKESFDFSSRLRMPGARPPVCDAQAPASWLEAGLSLRRKRVAHGEDQVVVGHPRFDPLRQFRYELFQKCCGGTPAASGANLREGFTGEVVHRSKGIVPLGFFPTIEEFQIQVEQLAGPTVFVTTEDFSFGTAQTIASMTQQHAAHAARADAQGQRNTRWSPTAPKAIFLAGAFSSTVPVPQRHEPLHARGGSWQLILQRVFISWDITTKH